MHKNSLLEFWKGKFQFTDAELAAFSSIDREHFVLPELKARAYEDAPLPILRDKTISQPSTVMFMTHALEVQEDMRVFEVGAGSGYQAAILSKLAKEVISAEVLPELVQFARKNLQQAHISNVQVIEAEGSKGFAEKAPYDRIMITCACKEFPPALLEQLKEGGLIVGPVGNAQEQEMVRGTKVDGKLELEFLGQFLFSPMYGKHGFAD